MLHINIIFPDQQKEYTTEAISPKGITDALYGIIYDFGFDFAQIIEQEINYWTRKGKEDGSIHGTRYNVQWFID